MSPQQRLEILTQAYEAAQAGNYQKTEQVLTTILSKLPDDLEVRLFLAPVLVHTKKLDEAVKMFKNLLITAPQNVEALTGLAHIYRLQRKFQDALRLFTEAAALNAHRHDLYYSIGNIQQQLGNLKAAFMAYAKTIELDPYYIPAYNNLGIIYAASGEYTKAINVLHQGLALERTNPLLHFNYGVALMANRRFEEAALEYESALQYKSEWEEALHNWGVALFKQGQPDKALEIFTRILERNPNNYKVLNNKGAVLMVQGRIQEAVQYFRQTFIIVPKYPKATLNLKRIMQRSVYENHSEETFQPFECIDMIPVQDKEAEIFIIKKPKSLEEYTGITNVVPKVSAVSPSEHVSIASSPVTEPALQWDFKSIERPVLLQLLKYLSVLTESLPPQKKEEFLHSEVRLDLEHIINNLEKVRETHTV